MFQAPESAIPHPTQLGDDFLDFAYLAFLINRIYNKILNRDWFSARLFVT